MPCNHACAHMFSRVRVLCCTGLHGQTPFLTYHGGSIGCFKITVKARDGKGEATIWEAKDNAKELSLGDSEHAVLVEVRGVGWGRLVGGGGWS